MLFHKCLKCIPVILCWIISCDNIFCRRAQDQFLKDEEFRISSNNEKALQLMQDKLERELENAKLELLEVFHKSLGKSLHKFCQNLTVAILCRML